MTANVKANYMIFCQVDVYDVLVSQCQSQLHDILSSWCIWCIGLCQDVITKTSQTMSYLHSKCHYWAKDT